MHQSSSNNVNFNQIANEQAYSADTLCCASVSRWLVNKNTVTYVKPDSHTLSLYVRGGETSRRADNSAKKGAPGRFCLMQQGQDSTWLVNGEIDFFHLYFTDDMLKRYAASTFETDVRFIDLEDMLYQEDIRLKQLFKQYVSLFTAGISYSPLFAEQLLHQIFHHLLSERNSYKFSEQKVTGGLSQLQMNLARDLIHAQLDSKLSIDKLAAELNLSPFHFARMFKISFGETPANFITNTRINRTKVMLAGNLPLSGISLETGFSHQSHMSKNFKMATGITPATYRSRLQQAS